MGKRKIEKDDVNGEEYDVLISDVKFCREFCISRQQLHRWDHDETLKEYMPVRLHITGRNYRSRKQVEAFKRYLMREALKNRRATG